MAESPALLALPPSEGATLEAVAESPQRWAWYNGSPNSHNSGKRAYTPYTDPAHNAAIEKLRDQPNGTTITITLDDGSVYDVWLEGDRSHGYQRARHSVFNQRRIRRMNE